MFSELVVAPPPGGRVFSGGARPGLADCAPSGRARLDAIARWLQDVAYGDVEDAGLAASAVWVVRRTRLKVARFPRFGEHLTLHTFCSGLGKMWAERRTVVARDGEAHSDIETVSLWVHLDSSSRRPSPFTASELRSYGDAAAGRTVSARLRHPPAPATGCQRAWNFRATDCDIAGHVNNAAYWEPFEEELLDGDEPRQIDVEMEFRSPAQPGEKLIVRDGDGRWIRSREGETHASLLIASTV